MKRKALNKASTCMKTKASNQFTALSFGLATAPKEFAKVLKEVKVMAQARGFRVPVPKKLVAQSPFSRNFPTTYPDPFGPAQRSGLGSERDQVGTNSPSSVQLFTISV